jgi:hypothetical protein
MTCLITADDQQRRIIRMENTGIKFVAGTVQFMNVFRFVTRANCPHSNQFITHRCQIITSRIPADRMDSAFMALKWQSHKMQKKRTSIIMGGHYYTRRKWGKRSNKAITDIHVWLPHHILKTIQELINCILAYPFFKFSWYIIKFETSNHFN